MGNVVGAGLGQNPARQAAIKAGLPVSVGATTINKVCGSGLKAVMLATQAIRLGYSHVVVAGGMENMSLAPYLLPQARQGYRMGNGVLVDSMIHDGLWDVYGDKHMGTYGDQCAAKYGFTKQAQDDFAVRSYTRARKAAAEGVFDDEIVPVEIKGKKGVDVRHGRRGAGPFQRRQAARPAARVRQRRHSNGRKRLEHQRRGGGACRRFRCAVREPAAQAAGADRRRGHVQPRAGVVHARADRRAQATDGQSQLVGGGRRSVRDQRGVFGRHDGGGKGAAIAGGESEYLRRCRRAGPPDRRQRRANPGHAAERPEANRRQARRRVPVHRRRRGRGLGRGNELSSEQAA